MVDRIRMGFVIPGDGNWSGGINYLRTVLATIRAELSGQITARLFISPDQRTLAEATFAPLLEVPVILDDRVAGAGSGTRALAAILTGRDRGMADLALAHGIDLMFESARFYGNRFPVPVLSWIPDFQHKYLPNLFGRVAWWKRELGFRAQCAGGREILLSSQAAQADCEQFYPAARGRTHVARFATSVPLAEVVARMHTVRADHDLPERFFFLPNQFWEHKNHRIVVAALRLIAEQGRLADTPPVILSGATADPRNPQLFATVMRQVNAAGLAEKFRHLGHIPYLDVLALNMTALAVVNPSRFEGWASSVEEAKAMGSPMILSDIPVHHEQAPSARFFGPDDASSLVAVLQEAARLPGRPPLDPSFAAETLHRKAFAVALRSAVAATGVQVP